MASSSNRRVRCFICKTLVPRSYADVDEFDASDAFALIPLRIGNKQGCICSECIQFYSLKLGTAAEQSSGKYGDGSNNDKLSDYGFSEDDTNNSPQTATASNNGTTVTTSEPKQQVDNELIMYQKKYNCLDYSLDSLLALVKNTVFGQDEAAKDMLYAFYINQLANLMEEYGDNHFKHKHILLIGGTGVGKTLLATTVAKIFGTIYSISNATPITSAGYIGDKVENVLERLLDAAGGNMELAQNGVVILDEIDKKRSIPDSNGRDVAGKAVQQELLKLLEPSTVWIKHNSIPFSTANITVIMMGACVGLDEIVEKRLHKKVIGFGAKSNSESNEFESEITPDDLIEYGFIPEFVGRIQIVDKLNDLSHSTLVDIIYQTLERYNRFFQVKNFEFYFNPLLVNKIADECISSKTGARDIEVKVDKILRPALFRIVQSQPNGVCEIGEDGEIQILRKKTKTPKVLEMLEYPPVEKYIEAEE